jgi:hypothetical protein
LASLSPVSPTYRHRPLPRALDEESLPHGPGAIDSQSTLRAPRTSQRPRDAPVVSTAKSTGSWPESLIVNQTPGCTLLITAAELSVRSA